MWNENGRHQLLMIRSKNSKFCITDKGPQVGDDSLTPYFVDALTPIVVPGETRRVAVRRWSFAWLTC
jgi:hypothetical protein